MNIVCKKCNGKGWVHVGKLILECSQYMGTGES